MKKQWEVSVGNHEGDVIPRNDWIVHTFGQGCVCRPQLYDGWLVVHRAADGREYFEGNVTAARRETVQ